jgi:hypothetical protein
VLVSILILALLLVALGLLPTSPRMADYEWGYYPSGTSFLLIIILLVLLGTGYL